MKTVIGYPVGLALLAAGVFLFSSESSGAGWCGVSKKENCGAWTVEMTGYAGGISSDDCVSYSGCVDEATWEFSAGTWNQLMLSKNGFCATGYSLDNTASFEVSYDAAFANASGSHRVCIVSWAKTTDDCNWTMDNTWELYTHEQSYNEVDNYEQWCGQYVGSAYCSGSEYRMYDCGDGAIDGQWALRCWRQSPRTSGTTDIQCLWNWWRERGTPNLYYYFTEIGAEVGPGSQGTFNLRGHDMVRTPKTSGMNVRSAPQRADSGVSRETPHRSIVDITGKVVADGAAVLSPGVYLCGSAARPGRVIVR